MMNNTARLQALQEAMKRKDEEIKNLRHVFSDVLDRDKEKQRLGAEMFEIQEEMKRLMILVQADEFVKQAKGYIALAREYVEANQEGVADAIRLLLRLVIFMRKKLEPELAEISMLGAQSTFRDCKNLEKAGYKHEDAMRIVLAKIAKPAGFSDFADFVSNAARVTSKMETKRG